MVPDGRTEWTDGQRQNYIPPTSSGDKKMKGGGGGGGGGGGTLIFSYIHRLRFFGGSKF